MEKLSGKAHRNPCFPISYASYSTLINEVVSLRVVSSYAHWQCTSSHKSGEYPALPGPPTISVYLLRHNRYICYIVIVIVPIIRGLNRPKEKDRSRERERNSDEGKNTLNRAQRWTYIKSRSA